MGSSRRREVLMGAEGVAPRAWGVSLSERLIPWTAWNKDTCWYPSAANVPACGGGELLEGARG